MNPWHLRDIERGTVAAYEERAAAMPYLWAGICVEIDRRPGHSGGLYWLRAHATRGDVWQPQLNRGLPFETLEDAAEAAEAFIVEAHAFVYGPTADVYARLADERAVRLAELERELAVHDGAERVSLLCRADYAARSLALYRKVAAEAAPTSAPVATPRAQQLGLFGEAA